MDSVLVFEAMQRKKKYRSIYEKETQVVGGLCCLALIKSRFLRTFFFMWISSSSFFVFVPK